MMNTFLPLDKAEMVRKGKGCHDLDLFADAPPLYSGT